jgi:murein L,D-transpeptidase YafK
LALRAITLLSALLAAGCAPARGQDALPPADLVVVDKSDRTLTLFSGGSPTWTVEGIQLGDAPEGHKQFEGDERTPEGRYTIDYGNPDSAYHLSLHISYPNAADRAYADARGRSPGGTIFIHGQPNALPAGRMPGDWTDGCIAVSNNQIETLWQAIPDGTPIDIRD